MTHESKHFVLFPQAFSCLEPCLVCSKSSERIDRNWIPVLVDFCLRSSRSSFKVNNDDDTILGEYVDLRSTEGVGLSSYFTNEETDSEKVRVLPKVIQLVNGSVRTQTVAPFLSIANRSKKGRKGSWK